MIRVLFCFGTRPETIKIAPVIHEAKKQGVIAKVCITGQHKEMLIPFLDFFELKVDYSLNIMQNNQTLSQLTVNILQGIEEILIKESFNYICVQGDTTSTFACALAAYYRKIPIIHIEAGLRTYDLYSPFPEEGNRQLVSALATMNFCPTARGELNLKKENKKNTFITGNTGIDSLKFTLNKFQQEFTDFSDIEIFSGVDFSKKIILITSHRRENHGGPLANICQALRVIAETQDCQIIYPVHLNPNVKNTVYSELSRVQNIFLIPPLDYPHFVWLMSQSYIILTDSGGVQEEAPFFKIPILVLRETTERQEIIELGAATMVGTNAQFIIETVNRCMKDLAYYRSFAIENNPYGNGDASQKILHALLENKITHVN